MATGHAGHGLSAIRSTLIVGKEGLYKVRMANYGFPGSFDRGGELTQLGRDGMAGSSIGTLSKLLHMLDDRIHGGKTLFIHDF